MPTQIEQVRRIAFDQQELGMGFNSDTGQVVGTALDFDAPTPQGAQEASSSASIVTTQEAVMESLNMSFEAEGRYALSSASLKAEFSRNTKYNSVSTFVVARMVVQNQIARGRNFRVKREAEELLETNQADMFARAFGDSFVRGLLSGGEFYAVMRITSFDTSVQQSLGVTLQAEINGGVAAGEFKGQFNKVNQNSKTRSEFNVVFYRRGGSGAEQIGTTLSVDDIKERLRELPTAVATNPFPYEVELATYDTIPLADASEVPGGRVRGCAGRCQQAPSRFPPEAQRLRVRRGAAGVLRGPPAGDGLSCRRSGVPPRRERGARGRGPPRPRRDRSAAVLRPLHHRTTDRAARAHATEEEPGAPCVPRLVRHPQRPGDHAGRPHARHCDRRGRRRGDQRLRRDPDGGGEGRGAGGGRRAIQKINLAQIDVFENEQIVKLKGIEHLGGMLPAGLIELHVDHNVITSLKGLERFTKLRHLEVDDNAIESIVEIGGLPELREVDISSNRIVDVSPLRTCTKLDRVVLVKNRVADLTPLADLPLLSSLVVDSALLGVNPEFGESLNPVTKTAGLERNPALANPFLTARKLKVRLGTLNQGPAAQFTGTAERIGETLRYHVELTRDAEAITDEWTLSQITSRPDTVFGAPEGSQMLVFFVPSLGHSVFARSHPEDRPNAVIDRDPANTDPSIDATPMP